MNSSERRKGRYERRKAKREEKRLEYKKDLDNFDNVANPDKLLDSALKAKRGIAWKTSPQRYEMRLVVNTLVTAEDLRQGNDVRRGFITFILIERGKTRHITSVHFGERVVQKALCQNVLVPILSRTLIYDNGACIKNKGCTFASDRLKKHLIDYYNKEKTNEGYVLLIDLSNFFGSIPHEALKKRIMSEIDDIELIRLICDFIDSFEGECGIGLGSETCQIEAVYYPSPVDHFIKDQLGYHGYGRYMDDSYVIGRTKEELEVVRDQIIEKYNELGLNVNTKKTKIVKLDSNEFKYLKNHVKLDENGKVVMTPVRESVTRMRRKLKKFKKLYDNGELTFEQVNSSYQSWRGFMLRKNGYHTVQAMDTYFKENFVVPERNRKNAENTRRQLEANQNSKRQQKKRRQNKKKVEVPTIEQENSIDAKLEEKFDDGSRMTNLIGRDKTRVYQKDKKKSEDKPGRKRITSKLVEKSPDVRMSKYEVSEMKREVDKAKARKQKEIKESFDKKGNNDKAK